MDPITVTFSPIKTPSPIPTTPLEASLAHLTSLIPTSDGLSSTLLRSLHAHSESSKNLLLLPGNTSDPTPDLEMVLQDGIEVNLAAKELCRVRLRIAKLDKEKRGMVMKDLMREAKKMHEDTMRSRLMKVAMEIPCVLEYPPPKPLPTTLPTPIPSTSSFSTPFIPPHTLLAQALVNPFVTLHDLSEKHPAGEIEKYCEDLWWVERVRVQLSRVEERVSEAILECVIAREEEKRRAGEWEDMEDVV